MNTALKMITMLFVGTLAQAAVASTLYDTDYSTDVSADWNLSSGANLATGVGLDFSGGWGSIHWGELTGAATIDQTDVIVTSSVSAIGTGNGSAYAEVAARTSNATDGIFARVFGGWNDADVILYDNGNIIAQDLNLVGLRSQFSDFDITLTVEGGDVTAVIHQTAGSSGSQSWSELTHTITGTATSTLGAGNVRLGGRAYTDGPLVTATNVSLIPEPGSLVLLAAGASLLAGRRRR